MIQRPCPVCATPASQASLFLEKNFDASKLSALSFASRKPPEFMCHRLVRCPTCDLVFVDEPLDQDVLARAYHVSDFDSADEAADAAESYIQAIRPLLGQLPRKGSVLEIGSGTGVFLEKLEALGFEQMVGVEPSSAAIAAAPPRRRAWLREAIFREEDFEPRSFDLVCCFMTMEHVRDPGLLAGAVARLLRPGGAFAIVVHDHRSWVNRLLGRRSPIIDIEHMQLFCAPAVERLFREAGMERPAIASFRNRYALRYWVRLLPLPAPLRRAGDAVLRVTGLAGVKVGMNVGNMMCFAFRPVDA
ncbi:MAG: class I SAM-dependent methyltransferase [Betaproteobacteria bacterium]